MLRFLGWLVRLLGVAVLLGALFLGAAWLYGPAPDHPFFKRGGDVLVIAHRGGAGLWPENTLYAFRKAVDMGVDVIEMDVRASRDGVPVVIHDATVDRTTDGSGRVAELSVAGLQRLDAGYRWTAEDPVAGRTTHPFRGVGIRIPTLDEVLEAFPGQRMNLEIKPDDPALARQVCVTLRRHGAARRALLVSRHRVVLDAVREACPAVATAASNEELRLFALLRRLRLSRAYVPMEQALQVPASHEGRPVVTGGLLRRAHDRNLDVHVWTINRRERMARLVRLGVDGVITDYPDRLREVLRQSPSAENR